ncbi:MAG: VIT1/CCC1 transporter family protein, partial [Candidatus Micrarchaeaceae archaeon]
MKRQNKESIFRKHYLNEMLHFVTYRHLASSEKNPDVRELMRKLSNLEEYHASLWAKIVGKRVMRSSSISVQIKLFLFKLFRRIFGLAFTITALEYSESNLTKHLAQSESSLRLSKNESAVIKKIRESEKRIEEPLEKKVISFSGVLDNIRDVIFGMNDGLVEVLAATVGLAAALQKPYLVLLGGFIIAISGTLSMAGGAYLSTGYEKAVKSGTSGVSTKATPFKSAMYVGLFYIFGAMFPLLPFAFRTYGFYGIVASLIITSIVLAITATIIA